MRLFMKDPQTYPQVFVDITESTTGDRTPVTAPSQMLRRATCPAASLCLQSAARSPQQRQRGNALFAIIQAAGWPIWFLLLASVIALALIIERSISLRESKIVPPQLFDQVVGLYQRQGVSDEVLDKLAKDSLLGRVLAAGLR